MPEVDAGAAPVSLRSYDDIAGRIHLTLAAVGRAIVLTEGKSDRAALRLIVGLDRVVVVGPKPQLLQTCAQLAALGDKNFVAVFDRDFEPLPSAEEFAWLAYDGGDLEAAVLGCGVGESLIENIVPEQKLTAAGGAERVLSEALEAIEPMCRLRKANKEKQWGLPFDSIDLGRYLGADGRLDCSKLVGALRRARAETLGEAAPSEAELLSEAVAEGQVGHFRGRDLLCVLEKYLRSTRLRHRKGMDPSRESLEAMVHVAAPGSLAASPWGHNLLDLVA